MYFLWENQYTRVSPWRSNAEKLSNQVVDKGEKRRKRRGCSSARKCGGDERGWEAQTERGLKGFLHNFKTTVFGLTSAPSQNAQISAIFAAMKSIWSIYPYNGYPFNGFSKNRMIKIVFFICFILVLTCLSLFLITFEWIEPESWDWAQKMRLFKLHLHLSLSTFVSPIPNLYLWRNR